MRAITDSRINYSSCYLKIFVFGAGRARAERRGVAHANHFPAAGRLMRAGRAGAGGGSDARAQRRPSLSAGPRRGRSERDDDTSLSQRQLVNANKPRSRGTKYSTFTLRVRVRAHRGNERSRQEPTHAQGAAQIARTAAAAAAAPPRCATFDNFSRKLTCSVAVSGHVARAQPHHQRPTSPSRDCYCSSIGFISQKMRHRIV